MCITLMLWGSKRTVKVSQGVENTQKRSKKKHDLSEKTKTDRLYNKQDANQNHQMACCDVRTHGFYFCCGSANDRENECDHLRFGLDLQDQDVLDHLAVVKSACRFQSQLCPALEYHSIGAHVRPKFLQGTHARRSALAAEWQVAGTGEQTTVLEAWREHVPLLQYSICKDQLRCVFLIKCLNFAQNLCQ